MIKIQEYKFYVLLTATVGLACSFASAAFSNEEVSVEMNRDANDMEKLDVINKVYEALNGHNVEELRRHLAEDVRIISLNKASAPIEGRDDASQALDQMLSTAKNSKFVFLSGPIVMGDIATVEYIHHYELKGSQHRDHNVSVFVLENTNIKKWLGYIHPSKE